MAVAMLEVSGATVSVTGVPPVGPAKLRVTPLITLLTVLVVLLMGTLSTVSTAFNPATAWLKLIGVVSVRCRLPVTARLPGAPEAALTKANRAPFASLMTLARTAVVCVLMAAAIFASVLFVEFTVRGVADG